ncbi:hypothetical protein OAK47_00695 [Planctomycetaceae bacterium]|jgi:hypothetical protein|nr:hypothetical protein [Planctomicrobium sp.]MDB4679780.1 hypothetical protein [Planctomycetaceae bacterium]MDC0261715.1 hypothetical protein [Planctomycetaceae bacterium]MDC0307602.1 hypothetical protein [Planctomycetaceae bacterium]MDG2388491.1 hypothetical protein [Planctomycetaceae bacterium]
MTNFMNMLSLLISPVVANAAVPVSHWMEQLFLAAILLLSTAFVFQGTWNGLMAEFPQIGRLSYFRAMHLVSMGGVILIALFYLLC